MTATSEQIELARESRLRSKATRQGYRLAKCRARSTENPAWSTFMIVDIATNTVAANAGWCNYGLSLDDVERFLAE